MKLSEILKLNQSLKASKLNKEEIQPLIEETIQKQKEILLLKDKAYIDLEKIIINI